MTPRRSERASALAKREPASRTEPASTTTPRAALALLALCCGVALGLSPVSVRAVPQRTAATRPILSFDSLVAAPAPLPAEASRPAPASRIAPRASASLRWPGGWAQVRFGGDGATDYWVTELDGEPALCAESRNHASALVRSLSFDAETHPILRFRFRVEDVVPGADGREKKRDDFAARIFVNFEFDRENESLLSRLAHAASERMKERELPGRALNYVWGAATPAGTQMPSPYTDRVSVVVVASGKPRRPVWRAFERDVVADFIAAFGHPPPPVHSVGVMSDSDDTGTRASACFGEITAATVFGATGDASANRRP